MPDEKYWDEKMERLPAGRRRLLQDHRLRWQVRRCWDGSPFYRARLESVGIDPSSIHGLPDLRRIPLLRRADLPGSASDQPDPAWTVAPEAWWREQARSEDGLPRVLTDGDLTQRAHLAARALWAAGTRPDRSLAAMADRPSGGTALGIADVAPVVAYACLEGEGDHWADDHFLIESIDPATGAAVAAGGYGAIVITDLAREGSPLIRFWTGWQANVFEEPCACGRTSLRSTAMLPLAVS